MYNDSRQPIFTSNAPTSVSPDSTLNITKPTFPDKLRESIKNPILLFSIFTGLIILIVIVAVLINHWNDSHDNQITITNLNDYVNNIPSDTRAEIYNAVFRAAQSNSAGKTSETLSIADAQIREGSAINSFNPSTSLYSGNFIVDIPSLKQSYRIYYEWIPKNVNSNLILGDYTTSVDCLHPDEYIYDFYPCIAPNQNVGDAYLHYLDNILPYNSYVNNDENSNAAIYIRGVEYSTGGTPFLRVNVNSCGNQKIMDNATTTVKKYIADHQLNPEDYTYKLNDLCDGEAG